MPSAVSIFPGLREAEIKEITNAITNDSTQFVNIWGSPGFGKTSTAVETAHHLSALGCPVYYLQLRGIDTIDKLLSKILSIFRSNLADVSLTTEDKIVSFFTEIPCSIYLMVDNIDDLLTNETSSDKLERLFIEFLNSNCYINMLVASRELLENMRDQIKGFQNVRIRPLSPVLSFNFVRQLLPAFSEKVVSGVGEISFHVPLAIKLVASLINENSEQMANKVLEELRSPDHRMEHFEKHLQKFFDIPYAQLESNDKHALISLTAFFSATICKDAAIDVVSGEMKLRSNAIRSLKTLVRKSMIDEDPNGEYYSIHPLIYSFILDKVNQNGLNDALHSAKARFCNYYLLRFESLNEDFLSGKPVDIPTMDNVLLHLRTVFSLALTNTFQSIHQHLFRILSNAEIFFFLICVPFHAEGDILTLYKFAIQNCEAASSDPIYLKLFVSIYFQNIAFSIFYSNMHPVVPKGVKEKIGELLDGTASKLSCYEGLHSICHGHVDDGIQQIETSIGDLGSSSGQLLLKCLCFQVLVLYYSTIYELDKAFERKEMAVKICADIGNSNLFFIADCESPSSKFLKKDLSEPLILFSYLLTRWSQTFCTDETKRYICNLVYNIQQGQEAKTCGSDYVNQIHGYADYVVAFLSIEAGEETLLNKKIEFLSKSCASFQNCGSPAENKFHGYWSDRLVRMYTLKGKLTKEKDLSVEACRKALDLSLRQYGKQHTATAECYFNFGIAENDKGNHSSALEAFCQTLDILSGVNREDIDVGFLGNVYFEQGKAYYFQRKFPLAIASFEKALEMKEGTNTIEEDKTRAKILDFLGFVQRDSLDLTSALSTVKRSLQIKLRLFSDRCLPANDVIVCYVAVGSVYYELGNSTEGKKCFEDALEINSTEQVYENLVLGKCFIYFHLVMLGKDENLEMEFLMRNLPVLKGHYPEVACGCLFMIAHKQMGSGDYEAGVASFQEVVNVELDVLLLLESKLQEDIITSCFHVLSLLLILGKSEPAKKIANRALQISETFVKCRQPCLLFRCHYLKGYIHRDNQEYGAAISSFEYAIQQISKMSSERNVERNNMMLEFACRFDLALLYNQDGRYKDSLDSLYKALPIIQSVSPEGSQTEAELFHAVALVAQKMKNRSLVVSNLRLAYKMLSKVLGPKHPQTLERYLMYFRALMNLK